MTHSTSSPGTRIVVVGKGGVGKSTVTALIARTLARAGVSVVAVDADEQQNLAACLGVAPEVADAIIPLASASAYVTEKTGSAGGGLLRLNPDMSDVVDRLAFDAPDGVRLLVMGGVRTAGGGCLCPETTVVGAAVAGMRLLDGDIVVMDTHAGAEHFGRALSRGFDTALVVCDPTGNALRVGLDCARLATELGIPSIRLVVNRVRGMADLKRATDYLAPAHREYGEVAFLPFDQEALDLDTGVAALAADSPLARAVADLCDQLMPLEVAS